MSFEEWKDQVGELVQHDCGVSLTECQDHGIEVDNFYADYESDPEDSAYEIAIALDEIESTSDQDPWPSLDPVDGRSIW